MSEQPKRFRMPWGTLLAISVALGGGALIGARLSSDAVAVLLGVVAGVAAGIPTALLLMAVTRRRDQDRHDDYEPVQRDLPPVIVVTPASAPQQLPPYAIPGYQTATPGRQRQFRVMGYEGEEEGAEAELW